MKSIATCRNRYQKRKFYRKLIESSRLSDRVDERPFANVLIFNESLYGLLDSGASVSVLGKDSMKFVERHHLPIKSFISSVCTADGSKQKVIGYCEVLITYKGVTKPINLYIVPSLSQTLYLGLDFWRSFALAPSIIPPIDSIELGETDKCDTSFHVLSSHEKLQLDQVIQDFPSFEKIGLGCTSLLEHNIDTGNANPIKCRHYPLSPPRQAEVYQELDRLLQMGVIEESNSPWCFPIVNVRKPGKIRLCLDSRKLNEITKKDSYPLPHINGLLSRLKDTYYISGIDLKDAFFQIRLTESSKEKTAFAVPGRPLYQFRVMPFGLCNGPQTMSRLMDRVIPSRFRDNVFIYLDDLLVCSATFEEHLLLLREVAKCLRNAGLTINIAKSKFCQNEIKYLGYRIGNGCLKVDPEKVSAIVNFPLPKTPRQMRRFIGMANWYRTFIPNFADLAGPLTDSLRGKKTAISITPQIAESFEKLKVALATAPVLAQPDFSREFVVQCDASRVGVGGVLYQIDDNGNERPISFVSKKLSGAQRNYTVTELECLAAVFSVMKFRPYIEGSHFKIVTDHSSLRWLMSQRDLSGRLARWSLKLQSFDFVIEHRKGTLNVVPDTLSRVDLDELQINKSFPEIPLTSLDLNSEEYTQLRRNISDNIDMLPDLRIAENVVQKRVKFRHSLDDDEEGLWRIWLPKSLHQEAIKTAHDICCHGGYFKTLSRLREKYYWPSMTRDVKLFVSQCDDCKLIKPPNQILRPPMGEAFITTRPFQRIYCDFLGPYPSTKLKNTRIFIAIDHFTKFIFLKPLKSATTLNVIDFLDNYLFNTFGIPQYLHSDNGKQFISKDFSDFLHLYGITHIKTGLYSPQANASERANREIISKIRYYLKDETHHQNWDKCINRILTVLRSDYHLAIQCSPYYALFGQNMVLHGSSYPLLEKLDMLISDTIVKRVDRLHLLRDKITQNLEKAHDKSSKIYNTRSKPISYQIGQEVFRKNHAQSKFENAISSKFNPKYVKCRIRAKFGNSLYDVEDCQGNFVGRLHASDLRP